MQTASRNGERPPGKRHAPQISISDDNYHVTEAIGDYYGKRESRPLSFVSSPPPSKGQQNGVHISPAEPLSTLQARNPTTRPLSSEKPPRMNGQSGHVGGRQGSVDSDRGPLSPSRPLRTRSNSDTANTQFPLNDIEYESNPEAVAQELSNLQALRRMSMNANPAGDPDLPSFNSNMGIPSPPSRGAGDEDDRSRLFWVPARIHPELAPTEFKTFIDSKVNAIKRRSGELSLSPDGMHREGSGGGLRRKKSMLSRQIDNSGGRGADGYQDGAEVLDRKRSLSAQETLKNGVANLQDLEALVNDSETVMQRLSLDTGQGNEVLPEGDMPILPVAPGGSLRRSTQTTYRRGSRRKGERVPLPRRVGKAAETDGEDSPASSPITPAGEALSLSRVQTEPVQPPERATNNFSRPGRLNRRTPQQDLHAQIPQDDGQAPPPRPTSQELPPRQGPPPKHFVSQIASNGRSSISPQVLGAPVPQIIETPPEEAKHSHKPSYVPERSSSHEPPPHLPPQAPQPSGLVNSRTPKWPPPMQSRPPPNQKANQTLSDIASHPSPLPGSSTRTDSLSFIPTLTEEKKPDSRKPKDKKEKETADAPRKPSWSLTSWMGTEDREKERKKEEEAKKIKSKVTKPPEKPHDNTRLDVLQTTMEGNRGRESLVLDRGDIRLEEERKKESSRKSSGGDKKEKDSGLFSSIFGGGKKKGGAEAGGKKNIGRGLSPEPPPRILKPDVDYNWTRFSILEERAIYRMAHIKLANPRRALHSQVLLSNFMYSYLAKVQQMHPQIQMPAQKQQPVQQKKADQPEEFYQYQKYQEQQHKQQQQEEAQAQATDAGHAPAHPPPQHHDPPAHMNDAFGHHGDDRHRPQSRASQYSSRASEGSNGQAAGHQHRTQSYTGAGHSQLPSYQLQQLQFEEPGRSSDDDMW